MASTSKIDLSRPLAEVLRECTKEAHENVEHSAAAAALLGGELSKEEYVRFLMMLWHVYSALEKGLERHATHPVLEPIYNPTLLERAPSLSADISFLLQVPEADWKSHAIHTKLTLSPPSALATYVDRINEISNSDDPSALVAHAYVRYLGDLSGGQNIRHTIAKAYGLDEAAGQGLSFYAFKELRSSKSASLGEMRRIKDWFRDGMNVGSGDNVQVKSVIADEANQVFRYNGGLFDAILEPHDIVATSEGKPSPASSNEKPAYGLSSVLAVIAAASLAHFFLVVGGFTDQRLAAEQWITSLWTSSTQ